MFRLGSLSVIGRFGELGLAVGEYLRAAELKGDRYTTASMSRMFAMAWLARDQPGEVRRLLELGEWQPPGDGYHLQHYFELIAWVNLALYEGDAAAARERLAGPIRALEGSLMMRMQLARAMADWHLGRLALAAGDLPAARKRARRLAGEGLVQATTSALLLEAGATLEEGGDPRPLLERAATHCTDHGLEFWAAVTRRAAGRLAGDRAGAQRAEEAERTLAQLGVRRPDRMCRLALPDLKGS
jgi:hypothetical protein